MNISVVILKVLSALLYIVTNSNEIYIDEAKNVAF